MIEPKSNGLFKPSQFKFLYDGCDPKKFAQMKVHFAKNLKAMELYEAHECEKAGKKPAFDDAKGKKIIGILNRCQSVYELEALKKCVFDLQLVPESYDQIRSGAEVLRAE